MVSGQVESYINSVLISGPRYVGVPGFFVARVHLVPLLLVPDTACGFSLFEPDMPLVDSERISEREKKGNWKRFSNPQQRKMLFKDLYLIRYAFYYFNLLLSWPVVIGSVSTAHAPSSSITDDHLHLQCFKFFYLKLYYLT